MNELAEATASTQPAVKTVQEYIDELPVWSDGTHLKSAPMTSMQWRIWGLAAAGKFFEGFVVFMTGVALRWRYASFTLVRRETALSALPAWSAFCSARCCWAASPTILVASGCSLLD
jgi:hypothetical protein